MSKHRGTGRTLLAVAAAVGSVAACTPMVAADPTTTTTTTKSHDNGPDNHPDRGAPAGLFSGTYTVAPYGSVVHVSSACPGCVATAAGKATVTMTWTGVGYGRSWSDQSCGTLSTLLTPTVVAGGFIQVLTVSGMGSCIGPVTGTWTRTGP